MQNLFAGFFVSMLIHIGLVLSLSNIFSIDLLAFQADYSQPIPAYLVYEKPKLVSKKENKIFIKKIPIEPNSQIDIKEMVLKVDEEILALESKASKTTAFTQKKIIPSQQNQILFFSSIIEEQIRAVWKKPLVSKEFSVELILSLVPTGEILDVKVKRSSGSDAFDRSALIAVAKVRKFENLKMPAQLFDDNFRNFTLVFKPY